MSTDSADQDGTVAAELDIPFTGPFFQEVATRKAQGRDAKLIITADHGQTGVGKTALATYLAKLLDTSSTGFDADEKATLDVGEFLELYDTVEEGSAVIFDEAEQLDSRRGMRNQNIDAAFKWQTRRVNQIVGILTLPSIDVLDKRMEQLADYWINIERRGQARIYEKRIHRIKKQVYYKTLQTFTWPSMDSDPDYQALTDMKSDLINKENEDSWIRKTEVEDRIESVKKDTKREVRDEIIVGLLTECEVKAGDVAAAFDIGAERLRQIAREA